MTCGFDGDDDELILVDDLSDQILRSTPISDVPGALVVTTGSRGEAITVEPIDDNQNLILRTAGGNDLIKLLGFDFTEVDGGEGIDTIVPTVADSILDLANTQLARLRQIERIDLTGDGVQTLNLDVDSARNVTSDENLLTIVTTDEDVVQLGTGWQLDAPVITDGEATHRLIQDDVIVQVNNGRLWQNPVDQADVDRSGDVSSLDALVVINRLQQQTTNLLPDNFDGVAEPFYFDVNDDKSATALDALLVINRLIESNAVAGEQSGGIVANLLPPQLREDPIDSEQDSGLAVTADRQLSGDWSGTAVDVAIADLLSDQDDEDESGDDALAGDLGSELT